MPQLKITLSFEHARKVNFHLVNWPLVADELTARYGEPHCLIGERQTWAAPAIDDDIRYFRDLLKRMVKFTFPEVNFKLNGDTVDVCVLNWPSASRELERLHGPARAEGEHQHWSVPVGSFILPNLAIPRSEGTPQIPAPRGCPAR